MILNVFQKYVFKSMFFISKERRESLLSFASLLACVTRSLPPRIGKLCAHGVAYPSLIPHTDISVSACVSVPMPESGNRGKRARLSSRDSENRFLRVSEQVISLRALFLSLYLSLSPRLLFGQREKERGRRKERKKWRKRERSRRGKRERREKVWRHPSRKPFKSFSDRCYLTI